MRNKVLLCSLRRRPAITAIRLSGNLLSQLRKASILVPVLQVRKVCDLPKVIHPAQGRAGVQNQAYPTPNTALPPD